MGMQTIDWSDVARWSGEQPREVEYRYHDNRNCAMAQYLRSRGEEFVAVLEGEVDLDSGAKISWGESHDVTLRSRTFGELHDKLTRMLGDLA
jgi:hypothetical protein